MERGFSTPIFPKHRKRNQNIFFSIEEQKLAIEITWSNAMPQVHDCGSLIRVGDYPQISISWDILAVNQLHIFVPLSFIVITLYHPKIYLSRVFSNLSKNFWHFNPLKFGARRKQRKLRAKIKRGANFVWCSESKFSFGLRCRWAYQF